MNTLYSWIISSMFRGGEKYFSLARSHHIPLIADRSSRFPGFVPLQQCRSITGGIGGNDVQQASGNRSRSNQTLLPVLDGFGRDADQLSENALAHAHLL